MRIFSLLAQTVPTFFATQGAWRDCAPVSLIFRLGFTQKDTAETVHIYKRFTQKDTAETVHIYKRFTQKDTAETVHIYKRFTQKDTAETVHTDKQSYTVNISSNGQTIQ
jgi:hypothetical protein